ncbi:MAG: hypothetical protein H0V44_08420 [Planctomycetes bacterium]|nr:hypothetical protein [Planctomycetota bacterium]
MRPSDVRRPTSDVGRRRGSVRSRSTPDAGRLTSDAPFAFGHRGDSRDHPENTAAAFDAAFAAGVDGVELDLRPTRDGVVVCHDASLARLGGGRRPLSRQTTAQARRIDVGTWFDPRFADQRLLTLDELLRRYAGRGRLLLELKKSGGPFGGRLNRRLCEAMVAAVQKRRAHGRVLVLCFDPALLAMVARLDPRLRLVRNCDRLPRDVGRWLDGQPWLDAVDFDRRLLTRGLVSTCHQRGIPVYTYSCNDARALSAALATGVDGVLSDRAGWLVQQLEKLRRTRRVNSTKRA